MYGIALCCLFLETEQNINRNNITCRRPRPLSLLEPSDTDDLPTSAYIFLDNHIQSLYHDSVVSFYYLHYFSRTFPNFLFTAA